ncbi:hypothetical protein DFP72DRAFT_854081 [Ephemerocybe angulata]|uniref:Uncharacterized protein n=1 Tax=Ephemerocybe angulata TaxID=980116 RepID=A0A8H6HK71_9AGAR|nr:hypothetical protein DFP72DRAFT_854081 [Tulosesus angulatus]
MALEHIRTLRFPSSLTYNDKGVASSSSSSWSTKLTVLSQVPILDARGSSFLSGKFDLSHIHTLPVYPLDEVKANSIVTVGFTANTYVSGGGASKGVEFLSTNIQFDLIRGWESSVYVLGSTFISSYSDDHLLVQFRSDEVVKLYEDLYTRLGSPKLSAKRGWSIFTKMVERCRLREGCHPSPETPRNDDGAACRQHLHVMDGIFAPVIQAIGQFLTDRRYSPVATCKRRHVIEKMNFQGIQAGPREWPAEGASDDRWTVGAEEPRISARNHDNALSDSAIIFGRNDAPQCVKPVHRPTLEITRIARTYSSKIYLSPLTTMSPSSELGRETLLVRRLSLLRTWATDVAEIIEIPYVTLRKRVVWRPPTRRYRNGDESRTFGGNDGTMVALWSLRCFQFSDIGNPQPRTRLNEMLWSVMVEDVDLL